MSSRSLRAGIALSTILGAVVVGGSARAQSAEVSTAVLGFEALDGAPDNVAAEITDALRQRVAATKGYQLVQGKDLVEVKLVFSCPDEAPACMAQAGKSMGATRLIFGNVKRSGPDYQVTIKQLDVNRAAVESWATESVPRRRAEPSVFRSLAPAWIAKLSGKGASGSLQIRANVQGAAVSLDGTRVGVTGTQPVVINDVSPGHHEVSVEKSGYTNTKQEFTLAAGQSLPLSLALSPVSVEVGTAPPPAAEETPPVVIKQPAEAPAPGPEGGSSHRLSRVSFWVAVVATFATAGAGLKFAKDVQQINSDLDPYRRIPLNQPGCSNSDTGYCGINGTAKPALLPQEKLIVDQKVADGHDAQRLETIFFVAAPILAIASGFFLYKGYLESDGETTTSARGLRIFPTASASAGGIVTEFDF
jgi:hypothetical protein